MKPIISSILLLVSFLSVYAEGELYQFTTPNETQSTSPSTSSSTTNTATTTVEPLPYSSGKVYKRGKKIYDEKEFEKTIKTFYANLKKRKMVEYKDIASLYAAYPDIQNAERTLQSKKHTGILFGKDIRKKYQIEAIEASVEHFTMPLPSPEYVIPGKYRCAFMHLNYTNGEIKTFFRCDYTAPVENKE